MPLRSSDDVQNEFYNINRPEIKDDKWFVFKDTIFSAIDTMDCDESVSGQCLIDKTFDECLDVCENNNYCEYGYYVTTPAQSICVPLRTTASGLSNPAYRLRKKDIYPEFKNIDSKVFIRKKKYRFPPTEANTVFYMDNILLHNVESDCNVNGLFLDVTSNDVMYSKNGDLQIKLLEIPTDLSIGTQYVPIKYGDQVAFNLPETNLVIRNSVTTTKLEWIARSFNLGPEIAYILVPLPNSNKKIGDIVNYSDSFSISSSGIFVVGVNDLLRSEIYYYKDYENAKLRGKNVTFKFLPKMMGWYCNNDAQCTPIALEKMIVDKDGIGTYDGLAIGRNPGCFGVCKYKIKNKPKLKPYDKYTGDKRNLRSGAPKIWILLLLVFVIVIVKFFF